MLQKTSVVPCLISTIVLGFVLWVNYFLSSGIRVISDKYLTLITPVNMTFSIWAIIYSFAIASLFIFWQKWYTKQSIKANIIIAYNTILLLNTLWISVWLKEYIFLSWFVLFSILLVLALINKYLIKSHYQDSRTINIFFEIHFSWICAAFFLNTLVVWAYYQGSTTDYGSIFLSIVALSVITILANFLLLLKNKFYFTMVFLWTLYGILLNIRETTPAALQLFIRILFIFQLILFIFKGIIILIRQQKFLQNNNDT
ncbi:MAG: hypothetical protein ACRCTJ_06875 [Brevinema sp.]